MTSDDRITPRNLGSLALQNPCLACFWWLSKLRFHPPLSHFGAAVFSDCQRMQEAMVGYYLEKGEGLPKQFAPFTDIIGRNEVNKHWSKFGYMHDSGVWLYGSPDEVFDRRDGTIVIGDHKTAHPKVGDEKDSFLPQYEIQTIGYGNIAEYGFQLGTTSGAFLLYWDLQHETVIADPGRFIKNGQLWTYFVAHVHEVEVDYSRIDALLKRAKKIWKSKVPPEGNEGCKDCDVLRAIFGIQTAVEQELSVQDQKMIAMSGNTAAVVNSVIQRNYDRRSKLLSAMYRLCDQENEPSFSANGMAANWQFYC